MSSGFRKSSTSFLLIGFPNFDLCFLKEFLLLPKQHIYNFVPFSKTLINTFPSVPMGSGLDHCLLQLTSRQALGFNSPGLLTTTPNSAKCSSVFLPFAHVSNALSVSLPLQILCFCQDRTHSSVPVNTVPTMRSLF